MTKETHHHAPARTRVRITVDEETEGLIAALQGNGIDVRAELRKGLRNAARNIVKTAAAIRRERAKRQRHIFFETRCGDKRGNRKPRA